ncbi:MAG: acetyltransferase [Planctomycetes bacterium]|nr:acetyltransferase [Planctomycetota bacterium]
MEQDQCTLLILGTRTFAIEVLDLASEIANVKVVGFVENMYPKKCHDLLGGLPVIWVDNLDKYAKDHVAVCALGTTFRSRFTNQAASYGIRFRSLVHPLARISARSTIGEGSIISVGAIIASHTQIGCHVIVNRGALIGHHTKIGNYVTIGPGANIAGSCTINDAVYIGMGAVIIDNVIIGSHAVIGAGSVVTENVPDNVQVVGVPAKIVKENISGK